MLLELAVLRDVHELQVFGDSKLAIDWMKEEVQIINLGLQ
jgi:hypothetical protein